MQHGDLAEKKRNSQPWAMVTAYDFATATVLTRDAGIEVLLVGDSGANTVLGYSGTNRMSTAEMMVLAAAVVRGAHDALVVVDMVFGSYEASDELAVRSAVQLVKETSAHVVKLEGGERMAGRIAAITRAGIPVCAHVGFTPQSVDQLGGFKVQGRGDGADALRRDVSAVVEAGASMVVLEMVPAPLAARITAECPVPTVGIGAGSGTDAQVLVWHDLAGIPHDGRRPHFVRRFGDVGHVMAQAARSYREAVERGEFPAVEQSFEE